MLEAIRALGASQTQTTSWVTGLCLAIAITTAALSLWHRMPVLTAWSTPGAALIAASSGIGLGRAVGAFIVAGGLIVLTALLGPLARLVERLPIPIASGMLAGVILKFVVSAVESARTLPLLVLPMIAVFFLLRLWSPSWAVVTVLVGGAAASFAAGLAKPIGPFEPGTLALILPEWDLAVLVGLGIPLYLVTMASQNLAGAAVLRAAGYSPPLPSILMLTGLGSAVSALAGSHTSNLAAISAAICTGPECHPDPARRWMAGLSNAMTYALLAGAGGTVVAIFLALPPELVRTIAGLALLGPFIGALATAVGDERTRLPSAVAFAVTASGVTLGGIGAAFWGLMVGLALLGLDAAARRR